MDFRLSPAVLRLFPSLRVGLVWVRGCVNRYVGERLPVTSPATPLSDACVLVSRRHGLAIRGIDFDRCEGAVVLEPSGSGGILPTDDAGPLPGTDRAALTDRTLHAVLLLESPLPDAPLEQALADLVRIADDYVGGATETYVLDAGRKSVELASNRSWEDEE